MGTKYVLQKDSRFEALSKLSNTLNDSAIRELNEIKARYWKKFKCASITTCDVSRTFLAYNLIFPDERHDLTVENIEKLYLHIMNYNYKK